MASPLIDKKEELVEITSLIEDCVANHLSHPEPFLCKEGSFSLHDSMAALEVMDRKMDCCEIPMSVVNSTGQPSSTSEQMVPPKPLPTSLKGDPVHQLPWDHLTTKDAFHICLENLTRLESLLSGASMAESTYTCLYVHSLVLKDMNALVGPSSSLSLSKLTSRLGALLLSGGTTTVTSTSEGSENIVQGSGSSDLPQLIVFTNALALVEMTDVIRGVILNADIYEEEDFSVNTFGLIVYGRQDTRQTEQTIQRTLDAIKEATKQRHDIKTGKNETYDEQIELMHWIGLILSFQLHVLKAVGELGKLQSQSVQQQMKAIVEMVRVAVSDLKSLQSQLRQHDKEESRIASDRIRKYCFDPYLYRPLVGSSPIRKVIFKRPLESLPILLKVVSELETTIGDLLLKGKSLSKIRRILRRISTSDVNILSRSLIVLNLYFEDKLLGQHTLNDLMAVDMAELSGIDPTWLANQQSGTVFLNRLAKPMYDTLKLLVLNRNRQRTYIEGVMLQDWTSLQREAHAMDASIRQEIVAIDGQAPPYFTLYALWISTQLMDHFVAVGIELDLFQGHFDLAAAFWYRDFLMSAALNQWTSMRTTKKRHEVLKQQQQQQQHQKQHHNSKQSKKQKGRKSNGHHQANKRTQEQAALDAQLDYDFMMVGIQRNLCRGLVRFMAALRQQRVVGDQELEFTSHEACFAKRFEAFASIPQPPPLSYSDFEQNSDYSDVKPEELLSSATDCFKTAKSMLEKLSSMMTLINKDFPVVSETDLQGWTKICVGNSVFLMKLRQVASKKQAADSVNQVNGTKVSFDFGIEKQFCTIRLE